MGAGKAEAAQGENGGEGKHLPEAAKLRLGPELEPQLLLAPPAILYSIPRQGAFYPTLKWGRGFLFFKSSKYSISLL